jgi:hypothetical protein
MKITNLPHSTKQAFKVIKEYIGSSSNLYGFTYCVAVTAEVLKKKIIEEQLAKIQAVSNTSNIEENTNEPQP